MVWGVCCSLAYTICVTFTVDPPGARSSRKVLWRDPCLVRFCTYRLFDYEFGGFALKIDWYVTLSLPALRDRLSLEDFEAFEQALCDEGSVLDSFCGPFFSLAGVFDLIASRYDGLTGCQARHLLSRLLQCFSEEGDC